MERKISKNRYLELKHFCLQYPEWKQLYLEKQLSVQASTTNLDSEIKGGTGDKTGNDAVELYSLKHKMSLVENAAESTSGLYKKYILAAVTENRSYTYLRSFMLIPLSKEEFNEYYYRFFEALSISRD